MERHDALYSVPEREDLQNAIYNPRLHLPITTAVQGTTRPTPPPPTNERERNAPPKNPLPNTPGNPTRLRPPHATQHLQDLLRRARLCDGGLDSNGRRLSSRGALALARGVPAQRLREVAFHTRRERARARCRRRAWGWALRVGSGGVEGEGTVSEWDGFSQYLCLDRQIWGGQEDCQSYGVFGYWISCSCFCREFPDGPLKWGLNLWFSFVEFSVV